MRPDISVALRRDAPRLISPWLSDEFCRPNCEAADRNDVAEVDSDVVWYSDGSGDIWCHRDEVELLCL